MLYISIYLICTTILRGGYYDYPHFTKEEAEVQSWEMTCPKPCSSKAAKLGIEPRQLGLNCSAPLLLRCLLNDSRCGVTHAALCSSPQPSPRTMPKHKKSHSVWILYPWPAVSPRAAGHLPESPGSHPWMGRPERARCQDPCLVQSPSPAASPWYPWAKQMVSRSPAKWSTRALRSQFCCL